MNEEYKDNNMIESKLSDSVESKADLLSDTPNNESGNKKDFISELYGNGLGEVKKSTSGRKSVRRSVIFSIVACCIALMTFISGLLIGLNSGVKVSKSDYAFLSEAQELRAVIKFIKENYYGDIDEKTLLAYAEYGVVDNLDAYSHVTTFDEAISSTAGSQYQVGIVIDNSVAGEFCISWVEPGSPAEEAGLKIGDKLVEVGYKQNDKINWYNVEKTHLSTVTALFSVQIKEVYIQVERDGTVREPLLIVRDAVSSNSVHAIYDFNSVFGINIDSDIGYIALADFTNEGIGDGLETAFNDFKLRGKKKLILDLRNNGGGSGDILAKVGSYFIKNEKCSGETPIIKHIYKNGEERIIKTSGYNYIYKDTGYEYKIAVLVNGGTASASEALIGAMIGAETCELIGETTYGKGIGQLTIYNNPNWNSVYSITYTAGYYDFFNDVSAYVESATGPVYNIHEKGFTPHVEYRLSKGKSNILSTDAQFLKAVEYLENLD